MSIKIVQKGGEGKSPNYREFLISDENDVASLPTAVKDADGNVAAHGSIAYTDGLTHVYQLCTDNIWKEV